MEIIQKKEKLIIMINQHFIAKNWLFIKSDALELL